LLVKTHTGKDFIFDRDETRVVGLKWMHVGHAS
jgi:hypothetical protein